MSRFICYDTSTGKITKTLTCIEEDLHLNLEPGEAALPVGTGSDIDEGTHFIDVTTTAPKEKVRYNMTEEITMAVGDQRVISLPEPCFVTVDGEVEATFEVDDNSLELEFTLPGEYTFTLESTHYTYSKVHLHVQED